MKMLGANVNYSNISYDLEFGLDRLVHLALSNQIT